MVLIGRYLQVLERKNKVKYGKFSNSRAENSDSSGPIPSIIKLIRDLMVIYDLTKYGADWLQPQVFVYKIQVNPIHTILKYGIFYDFMDR